jgi:tyrosyl-tRNA synthetase
MKSRTEKFIGEAEILKRLEAGKTLRVKLGVDPTRPDLTFGHMVVFQKLRQFQELGHQAVLIIGDYTTRIGDPTGKSETRPVLSEQEIEENAKTYLEQAYQILDPKKTEVRRNSEWFGKMSFLDALQLSRRMTVAQMLARDDFAKRHASNTPISIVEFLYPLLQGYDSVMLKADIEIGGSDQLFNMLVGRDLPEQERHSWRAQLLEKQRFRSTQFLDLTLLKCLLVLVQRACAISLPKLKQMHRLLFLLMKLMQWVANVVQVWVVATMNVNRHLTSCSLRWMALKLMAR